MNISNYFFPKEQIQIDFDFGKISEIFNTIIIILPAEDTKLYFNNLNIINKIAQKHNLKVIYGIFPNEKYGNEKTYLIPGKKMYNLVLKDMEYMSKLTNTSKTALWFGWSPSINPQKELIFYNSLPKSLKKYYAIWLDEEYRKTLLSFKDKLKDVLFITEWYQKTKKIDGLYYKQLIISGISDVKTPNSWLEYFKELTKGFDYKTRDFGFWEYNNKKDGSGEDLTMFFPNSQVLVNPFK